MKKCLFIAIFICLLLYGGTPSYAAESIDLAPTAVPIQEKTSDSLLIFFKNKPTVRTLINIANQSENLSFKYGLPNSNTMVADTGSQDKNEVMENLRQNPEVSAVTNDPDFQLLAVTNDPGMAEADVPGITKIQWNLVNMKFAGTGESAWDLTTGSAGVNVAVIDSGVDSSHEDLAGKLSSLVDCTGITCQELTSMTADPENFTASHGTHVSGLAAAATNNSLGVAGSGYNTKIIMIRVMDTGGRIKFSYLINALHWAADHSIRVANVSIGQTEENLDPSVISQIQSAVQYAWERGMLLVASAGNCGGDVRGKITCAVLDSNEEIIGYASNSKHYPAASANVLSVASLKHDNTLASYSNHNDPGRPAVGNWISVAAPGGECTSAPDNKYYCIPSTWPGNQYRYTAGTSMSAPQVAGLAALMLAVNPVLTNSQIKSIIESSANRSIAGQATNFGGVDAISAVREAVAQASHPTATLTPVPTATTSPISTPTVTPTSGAGNPTSTPTPSAGEPTPTASITPTSTPSVSVYPTTGAALLPKTPPDPYPSPPFCPQTVIPQSGLCTAESKSSGDANCDRVTDNKDYLILNNQYDTMPPARPENQNANFSCREGDSSTYFVDLVDFEIWRKGAKN